jgi:hypothetical protein
MFSDPMIMEDWAEKQAEAIVDRFVADESSADLWCLQQSIVDALHTAYQRGKEAKIGWPRIEE